MFFRLEKPKVLRFDDHLENVQAAGFQLKRAGDEATASRGYCATTFKMGPDGVPVFVRSGIMRGEELAVLVYVGYQMTLKTDSGKTVGAQAAQLTALHEFEEDLREALGMESYYNTSLGTISTRHQYDRLERRDLPPESHPWKTGKVATNAR